MANIIDLRQQDFSFLGKGSRISGSFILCGTSHIASTLEGELQMEDEADLVIEAEGFFKGNINCHKIEIYGRFEGSLVSSGKVTIYPSAVVSGEIQAEDLVIHPGAVINMEGKTIH